MERKTKNIICPECNSHNVATIMYGMPAFSPALMSEIKSGAKKLGGCCVKNESPDYTCNDCGKEWKDEEKMRLD